MKLLTENRLDERVHINTVVIRFLLIFQILLCELRMENRIRIGDEGFHTHIILRHFADHVDSYGGLTHNILFDYDTSFCRAVWCVVISTVRSFTTLFRFFLATFYFYFSSCCDLVSGNSAQTILVALVCFWVLILSARAFSKTFFTILYLQQLTVLDLQDK